MRRKTAAVLHKKMLLPRPLCPKKTVRRQHARSALKAVPNGLFLYDLAFLARARGADPSTRVRALRGPEVARSSSSGAEI